MCAHAHQCTHKRVFLPFLWMAAFNRDMQQKHSDRRWPSPARTEYRQSIAVFDMLSVSQTSQTIVHQQIHMEVLEAKLSVCLCIISLAFYSRSDPNTSVNNNLQTVRQLEHSVTLAILFVNKLPPGHLEATRTYTHTHAQTRTSTEEEKQTVKFSFRLLTTRQGRSFRLCLGQLTQSMGSFLPVPVDDRFTSGKSVRGPLWSLAVSAVWVSRCAQWSSRLTFQPIGKSGTLCVDWYITLHFAKIEVFCSNSQFTIYRQIILFTR